MADVHGSAHPHVGGCVFPHWEQTCGTGDKTHRHSSKKDCLASFHLFSSLFPTWSTRVSYYSDDVAILETGLIPALVTSLPSSKSAAASCRIRNNFVLAIRL